MRIYVDADACPVKAEVQRVARRHAVPVTLVAGSWMRVPMDPNLHLEVVDRALDAADDWIVEHIEPGDVVITSDIPLAARCLAKGACALGATGREFTESNIGDALATRTLLSDLRGAGEVVRGPAAFDPRDRSRFLQALDLALHRARRKETESG